MATCPNGHQVQTGAIFCTTCGADVRVACPNGHLSAPGARFCETCGAVVASGVAGTQKSPTPTTPPSTAPLPEPPPPIADATPLLTNVPDSPEDHEAPDAVVPTPGPSENVMSISSDGARGVAEVATAADIASATPGEADSATSTPEEPPAGAEAPSVGGAAGFAGARDAGPGPSARTPSGSTSNASERPTGGGIQGMDTSVDNDTEEVAPKSKRKLLLAGVGALILLVAGVGVVIAASSHSSPSTTPAAHVEQTTTTQPSTATSSTTTTSTLAAGPAGWTYPTSLETSSATDRSNVSAKDVSCVGGGTCFAVDSRGDVLTSTNQGGWTVADQSNGSNNYGNGLTHISCSSTSSCAAISGSNSAVVLTGTNWSDPVSIDQNGGLSAVSCASSTLCVAVDGSGNAAVFTGTVSNWTSDSVFGGSNQSSSSGLTSVSCPTPTFCMAVGQDGVNATFNGSSWTTGSALQSTGSDGSTASPSLGQVSCASPIFCVATDTSGNAFTFDGSSWGTGTALGGTNSNGNSQAVNVSCPANGFCVAVNNNGGALVLSGGTWSSPTQVDGNNPFQAISCWSATRCAAIDQSNNVLFYGPRA